MPRLTEIGGKRLPFLRWSFVRMALGNRRLMKDWQVGDGREEALAEHVLSTATRGDVADAIRAIDAFAYGQSFLINVGDEKGEILDAAIRRVRPRRLAESSAFARGTPAVRGSAACHA